MRVTLIREETSDQGTFGHISVGGLSFFTGELPWRNNAANVSCIPKGFYECRMTYSPRFARPLYLVQGVPGRFGVRIHPANFMGDSSKGLHCQLNGCIALGERVGFMDGQKAVLISQPAVREFQSTLGGSPFDLEVK